MTNFWKYLGVIALASVIIGCNSQPPASTGGSDGTTGTTGSKDTIKMGLVASRNGALRPWGEDSVNGAMLAVEEINKAGGIDGKRVELMIGDSQSDAEKGKTAAEKLVSDGAMCLLGEVASGITMQMANVAVEKGLPLVAVGATKTDITSGKDNVFRVCYTDDFQGPVMATFAFKELGLKNVAIITDKKQPYSTYLSGSFRKTFESLGGKVVSEEFYNSGDTQFSAQITNMKAKKPDGLFLSGYFTEVGPIVRQAKEAGLDVPVMGGDGWDSTELVTSGGEAIIGGYFCNHYNNQEDRPEVKSFLDKWKAKYGGEPGTTMGALGYDAAMLMMDAIKRSGGGDPKKVTEALANTEGFASVSGIINLKGMGGNPPKRALVVEVTREGQDFVKAYEPTDVQMAK